jgi:hypothetical protein
MDGQVLGVAGERIQGQTHRGVFNIAGLFKPKLCLIKAEVIKAIEHPQRKLRVGSLTKESSAPSPQILGTLMDEV